MRRFLNIVAFAALFAAAVSCSYERKSFPVQDAHVLATDFAILSFVPQDAPAVFCLNECAAGLAQVYAKEPMDSLDFGPLASSRALLSFFQDGKLRPCLYIDCTDTAPEVVEAVSASLAEKGLKGKVFEKEGRKVLFLTPSDQALDHQEYSLAGGKSVLDAAGFKDALSHAPAAKGVTMFFNNGEAAKLPGTVLSGLVTRKKLSAFFASAAAWTVISDEDANTYDIAPLTGDDDAFYLNVFSSLKPEQSRVCPLLSRRTHFMIDLPVSSWKQFSRSHERFLKARSRKPAAGYEDALAWAKMVNPKEFAYIHFARFKVVAVHAGSRFKDHEPARNPYQGVVAALLGSAFQLNDDSCYAVKDNWIVIGAENAVKAFLETSRMEEYPVFASKKINYAVYRPGVALWDEGGLIRLQFGK
ncbi:MAG: hypothetical protein IJS62_03765 [Bacteroidales bacterium]|nr:hypothetical protein [Bacteroidales bacterium]